jgi:hypothetical protein
MFYAALNCDGVGLIICMFMKIESKSGGTNKTTTVRHCRGDWLDDVLCVMCCVAINWNWNFEQAVWRLDKNDRKNLTFYDVDPALSISCLLSVVDYEENLFERFDKNAPHVNFLNSLSHVELKMFD